MSLTSPRYFRTDLQAGPPFNTVLPFIAERHKCVPDYSGRAAILSRERSGAFPVPSHRRRISPETYSSALPPPVGGRSRIFIGQCCQPFCPGDPTNHLDGPRVVTKSRHVKERIRLPGLCQATELHPPSQPKRDTSRTILTWPLRHRLLPSGAGCIPFSGSSEDFRTSLDPPG